MSKQTSFAKYEGLGNDFVVVEDIENAFELSPETVVGVCDRRFGIGADGLLIVRSSNAADYEMLFYNSDGTVAEMCGNGVRCFAKYLHDESLIDVDRVRVMTGAGVKEIELVLEGGRAVGARVDMGTPVLEAAHIPVQMTLGEMNDTAIEVDGIVYDATFVSMGNPHCVIFVDELDEEAVLSHGPLVEVHPMFPNKMNVEFAKIVSPTEIELRVWERGVGETLACGTGACAAAVAANIRGYSGRKSTVHLKGGDLEIEWLEDGRVIMTGAARKVFSGEFDLSEF